MAGLFSCCFDCCDRGNSGHVALKEMPTVQLDTHHMGVWGVGVATQKANLNQVPMGRDTHSLVLRQDGTVYHNNEEKNRLPANSLPQEGDVVGVSYDHVEMNLYLNGKNMNCPASGIRGTVFPVVYVDDSAILDCQFSDFYHPPPQGYQKILFEQQIF
ncbi:SPRY domain-containing protein 7 [Bagarius yarrelli]|uniref:SPRY domain-containing protein 7 n=1 Tax=Bagarius yarrelli TaxID=175774 RepID=A0A556TKP3_BAGYA|nr:SPRY domain-containing protein 7 [Bagarius yarrelli]